MDWVRLAHVSSWWWIALLFLAQALGSIGVTYWFRLGLRETALPIAILLSGAGIAISFARWNPRESLARWLRSVPMLLYALFIYALSSRSYPGAQVTVNTDLFHLVEFSTLGFLLACCCYPLLRRAGAWLFTSTVVSSGLLYAVSDEIHQSFVPGRTATTVDLAYDATALVASCLFFLVMFRLRMRFRRILRAEIG